MLRFSKSWLDTVVNGEFDWAIDTTAMKAVLIRTMSFKYFGKILVWTLKSNRGKGSKLDEKLTNKHRFKMVNV